MTLNTLSGRPASQNEVELNAFIAFMQDCKVQRYLEIGARHGDTFYHVMRALGKTATGIAVDLPGAAWGTSASVSSLRRAVQALSARTARAQLILGDSHAPEIIHAVAQHAPYDLVLIDGDHRYQPVLEDFRNYCTMARYVAFHDIAGEGQTSKSDPSLAVEVPRLWNELKTQFKHREFIDTGSRMGIGVLEMHSGNDSPPEEAA